MTKLVLYTGPFTCALAPLILLEEIGAPFESRLVRMMTGEHKSPDFKRHNPQGKVPTLLIDGEALAETVAIAVHLDAVFPAAGLLPKPANALERARQIADLCFCVATLHPFVTRICVPQLLVDPAGVASVQALGKQGMREYLDIIETRLAAGPWWYGDAWSAMDACLYWVFWRLGASSDFDRSTYPRLLDHGRRMETRPAVQRAMARNAADFATLDAEGLMPKPVTAPA